MSTRATVALLAGLVAIAGIVTIFAGRFGTDPERGLSPIVGAPVPDIELPMLDLDETVNPADLDASGEVLVINFFASWCLQCRNEHADLVATADTYADRDVSFVGIAFQNRDDQARGFLDELGRGETMLYTSDPGSVAAIELGVFGIPETIFVRNGEVVGKLIGESDALTLSSTLEQILAGETVGARQVGEYQQQPGG